MNTYPEGFAELAPPWVKPTLGTWSAEAPQLFFLKGRDLLPHPLVFLYPALPSPSLGPVGLSSPLSQFLLLMNPPVNYMNHEPGRLGTYFLGWFSAILVS